MAKASARDGSHVRFLGIRRMWWKLRYRNATCRVVGAQKELSFHYSSPKVMQLLQTHYGEQEMFSSFLGALNEGDAVWDVGAARGLYSVFAADLVRAGGDVYAFEPQRDRARQIEKNARLNGLENVHVLPMALSSRAGKGNLAEERLEQSSSGSVQVESGDGLVEKGLARAPNVVKIDVEGGEGNVIRGMKRILADPSCRFVFLEVHDRLLEEGEPEGIAEALRGSGFRLTREVARGGERHWFFGR